MTFSHNLRRTLKAYGPKSSLHGFYHIYQSKTPERKLFWLFILCVALGVTVFHTVMSVTRYLNNNVFVHVSDEASKAIFPDITLCNLKPFSESLLEHYPDLVHKHFKDNWNYFKNWYLDARQRKANETDSVYKDRLKKIFSKFMEIVWVSDDSTDLGMTVGIAILQCSYEGIPCDKKNFTIVRNPDSWNCYNMAIDGTIPVGNLGLMLTLFTDSSFIHPISDESAIYLSEKLYHNADKRNLTIDLRRMNSLKEMIGSKFRSLNQVAERYSYQSDGVRVIVHQPKSHPLTSPNRLEFESGVTGLVTINQMMIHRLHRSRIFECQSKLEEKVRYVTYFASKDKLKLNTYNKMLDDYVIEEKQRIVHDNCNCYSHRYPFWCPVDRLCYFAPEAQKRHPTKELIDRIDCHDQAVLEADKRTYSLIKKFRSKTACESTKVTFSSNVFVWPTNEEISSLINEQIIEKFSQGTEFLPGIDFHRHTIFNLSDKPIAQMLGDRLLSREHVILRLLLDKNMSRAGISKLQRSWSLEDNERLRQNVLKLSIKHWRSVSRLAKEYYSYTWPEALSEIGGIFGLWLGVSALILFEIAEVAISVCLTSTNPVSFSYELATTELVQERQGGLVSSNSLDFNSCDTDSIDAEAHWT